MTHIHVVWVPIIISILAFLFPFVWPNKGKYNLDLGSAAWFLGSWFYGLFAVAITWAAFAMWLMHHRVN